jgi:signal transduction histidine kinase
MKNGPDQYILSPWSLRFEERAVEAAFRQSWLKRTSRINQIWGWAAVLFYAFFTYVVLDLCLEPELRHVVRPRYLLVLPLLILGQLGQDALMRLIANPNFAGRRDLVHAAISGSYLLQALTAFGVSLHLFVAAPAPCNQLFFLELGVIFVFCQHFLRAPFPAMLAFSAAAAAATAAVLSGYAHPFGADPAPVYLVVLGLVAVGVYSAYTRELFVRRNYRAIQVLKAEKARSETLAEGAERKIAAGRNMARHLALMSHELRTPLNAIIGSSEAMRAGRVDATRLRLYLDDIGANGRHLLHLVDHILDLTRAEEDRMRAVREMIALDEHLGAIARSFAPTFESAGIAFSSGAASPDLRIVVDRDLLRQMLSNLLANALKYTARGGRVSLAWRRGEGGEVEISVADTGIGIDAKDLPKALDFAAQIDGDLARKFNGIGIGLPLTRELAEAQGGRLALESEPGVGTTARLAFPAAPEPSVPVTLREPPPPAIALGKALAAPKAA